MEAIELRLARATGFNADLESQRWIQALLRVPQEPAVELPEKSWGTVHEELGKALKGQEAAKRALNANFVWWRDTGDTRDLTCLVGPPGVGKTTLVESMGKAFGRPVETIRLDLARDRASLLGYTPTWEAADLGAVLEAICRSKCTNPIIFLDEADKVPSDADGLGVENALNALLDRTKKSMTNLYLGIEIDLSQVTFVLAANSLEGLCKSLQDRLNGRKIEMKGYDRDTMGEILDEKFMPLLEGMLRGGSKYRSHPEEQKILTLTEEGKKALLDRHVETFGEIYGVRILQDWLDLAAREAYVYGDRRITAGTVHRVLG